MRRKLLFFTGFFLLCIGTVFLCQKQIMIGAVKYAFRTVKNHDIQYKEMRVEGREIVVQGLHLFNDKIDLNVEKVRLKIEGKKLLANPKAFWRLIRNGVDNPIEFFLIASQYAVEIGCDAGVLTKGTERYFFQFKPSAQPFEVGILTVSLDPGLMDHPFLATSFQVRQGGKIIGNVQLDDAPVEQLVALGNYFTPSLLSSISGGGGRAQVQASFIFNRQGTIEELATKFQCQNLTLLSSGSDLEFACDGLSGNINYPEGIVEESLPIWKKAQCSLTLENGQLMHGAQFSLSHMNGNLMFDPRETPTLQLTGQMGGSHRPLYVTLNGKGALHEDHAYWLEFDLNVNDRVGTECNAYLSVCRPQLDNLVMQLEASNLLPQQVEMLKNGFAHCFPSAKEWKVEQGDFGGKVVVMFDRGVLSHFEVSDFIAHDVVISSKKIQPIYMKMAKVDGRLFEQMQIETHLPLSHLCGFINDDLREIYASYRPDSFAKVNATMQFGEKEVATAAAIQFVDFDQTLQFGFTSSEAFPSSIANVFDGWARSEKLTEELYGPIVKSIRDDLELYGNIDLLATFEGKTIDCSLQIDHFLAKHPLLNLKAARIGEKEKTAGRVKLKYNPLSQYFEASFPIRNGQAYEGQWGFYLTDVEGDFQLTPTKLTGNLSQANLSWDSVDLLKDLALFFSFDETLSLHEVKANLAWPHNRSVSLHMPHLNGTACEFRLLDEKNEIIRFKAARADRWQGALQLSGDQETTQCDFSWDPLTNHAESSFTHPKWNCTVKKDGDRFHVDRFSSGDFAASGSFHFAKGALKIDEVLLSHPAADLSGSGDAQIDLDKRAEGFGLFGLLDYEVTTKGPISVTAKAEQPIHWAYSSDMGLVVSGVDLKTANTNIQIDQIDRLCSGKTTIHHIAFDVAKEFTQELFEKKIFPSVFRDFKIFHQCKGTGHIDWDGEKCHFRLGMREGHNPYSVDGVWKGENGSISLGDKEELTLQLRKAESGGVEIVGAKGSFGRLSAQLKETKNGDLKGEVKLDFSLLQELFDLPINSYLNHWKAKSGYTLEGVFHPASRLADWGFSGKLKGKNFECGELKLRALDAKIEVEPGQITFENLDLTDDSGKLWVEEGALVKSPQGRWIVSLPLIEIRGFQPSFLKKDTNPDEPILPLIFKTATIKNVRGYLDDFQTLTGSGHLRFTNKMRANARHLPKNLPLEMLRQMGLDGGLFVPVSGEMDYSLQNGRIYVRGIRNVFSEKNRSEFIPPKNGVMGYFDLQGNLFLDLLVRQNVIRSIPSPLVFKVRGTWDDPSISIK